MKLTKTPSFTSYQLIKQAGCEVEILRTSGDKYDVHLTKAGARVASATVPRTGVLTMPQVRQRVIDGKWGPSSGMAQALAGFAAMAPVLEGAAA